MAELTGDGGSGVSLTASLFARLDQGLGLVESVVVSLQELWRDVFASMGNLEA